MTHSYFTPERDRKLLEMREAGFKFVEIAERFGNVDRKQCRNRFHYLTTFGPRERAVSAASLRDSTGVSTQAQDLLWRRKCERACQQMHEATMTMLARRAAQVSA